MTKRTHISGIDETIRNLNKQVERIEGVTLKGMSRAGFKIRRESQEMCPVVTGNLKASAYNKMLPDENNPTVEIGYTAVYAARVHENPNAGQTPEEEAYTKTGKKIASTVGQWKFLEEAVKQNENYILDVIRREAKL